MAEIFDTLKECLKKNELVALATILDGKHAGKKMLIWSEGGKPGLGKLDDTDLYAEVVVKARIQLDKLESGRVTIESTGQPTDVYIDVYPPPLRLVIIGAVHIAIPLVSLAKTMGIHTTVIDARSAFATRDRFPLADELIVNWPTDVLNNLNLDEGTCLVTLTHDEKFDNPALALAVRSKTRYIGALGSPKTHAKRVEALKEMGLNDAEIGRIHAPIGLKIGAKSTEEIALSIITELVAVLHGKTICLE